MQGTLEASRGQVEAPFSLEGLRNSLTYAEESSTLPIAKNSARLKDAIRKSNNIILEADPGSGKSTVAPIIFLNEILKDNPDARIAITQPRRLATSSVAEFVGSEVGEENVDHRFKGKGFDKPNSRIQFSVVDSLLKELVNDETLTRYDAVMVDEVHERSIPIDILIPLLLNAQEKRAQAGMTPLKIILASATLDADVLANYLPGAERLHVEGVPFDVKEHFSTTKIKPEDVMVKAAEKVAELFADKTKTGDALIFMPGRAEIAETEAEIRSRITDPNVEIITITGGDDEDAYAKIKNKPPGKKIIYIATPTAETSITIDGIKIVIDSGLVKRPNYDPITRLTTLETIEHTKGNWTQRKRRAGRTQDGEAHALFTEDELAKRDEHQVAEFLRSNLTPQVLRMKAAGIKDLSKFRYIERPNPEVINQGIESLQRLGALDHEENITPIGNEMAEMDLDPMYARMMVEAKKKNCAEAVSLLVSAMQSKDSIYTFDRKKDKFSEKYKQYIDPDSDFITFLNVWNDYIKDPKNNKRWQENGFNPKALARIGRESKSLRRELGLTATQEGSIDINSSRESIDLSIASGLVPNQLMGKKGEYRFATGSSSGIQIDKNSVFHSSFQEHLLSGKIQSIKNGETRTFSQMNMKFDKEKMLLEYWYLRKIFNSEKPNGEEVPSQPKETQQVSDAAEDKNPDESALVDKMQEIEHKAEDTPSESVAKETESFIQKIRTNWHQLTDKIKEMYIRFKNSVKRIVGL